MGGVWGSNLRRDVKALELPSNAIESLSSFLGMAEGPVMMTRENTVKRRENITHQRSSIADLEDSQALGEASSDSTSMRMSRAGPSFREKFISKIEKAAGPDGTAVSGLEARLETFGSTTMVMKGDGNCQFRSFAFNLFRDQAHHAAVRKSAVRHIKKHADFFSVFFEYDREFKKYLSDMAKDRTWGDELTVRAVVEAYGCVAHVITSEPMNWYLVYEPEDTSDPDPKIAICPRGHQMPPKGKQVFLSYVSPIHYNAIVAGQRSHTADVTDPLK